MPLRQDLTQHDKKVCRLWDDWFPPCQCVWVPVGHDAASEADRTHRGGHQGALPQGAGLSECLSILRAHWDPFAKDTDSCAPEAELLYTADAQLIVCKWLTEYLRSDKQRPFASEEWNTHVRNPRLPIRTSLTTCHAGAKWARPFLRHHCRRCGPRERAVPWGQGASVLWSPLEVTDST